MLRLLTCGLVALTLVFGLVLTADAAKGKKGKAQHGTVKAISKDTTDTKITVLTVTVKVKKETSDVDVKLTKDIQVLDDKGQPVDAKDYDTKLPAGTKVALIKGDDGNITTVKIGGGKKKKKSDQ